MTRLAVVADTHANEHSRFQEHNRIMAWVIDDAHARGCETVAHTGDVWERKSTPLERLSVADWVQYGSRSMNVIVIGGNHDTPEDIEWIGRLQPANALTQIHSVTQPESVIIHGIEFCCLPWPRKGHLLAANDASITHAQSNAAAVLSLQDILRGFGPRRRHTMARVLLAHCMMRGSQVSKQQPPLVGMDFELGLEDLGLVGADFYALGHIHLGQEWSVDSGRGSVPVVYPGSPRRCTFGETDPKGYLVLDFNDDGKLASWERVPTPCTPMVLISGEYEDGVLSTDEPEDIKGAEVRVRYSVAADQRQEARAAAHGMRDRMVAVGGALSVVLEEETIVEKRSRSPEVAQAVTIAAKLGAYWDSTRRELTPERRERLLKKLAQLEEVQ